MASDPLFSPGVVLSLGAAALAVGGLYSTVRAILPAEVPGVHDPPQFGTAKGAGAPKTYDYIIVGGGTAGCVLAARLTDDPNVSVLVLEAGSSAANVLFSLLPSGFSKLFKTPRDWELYTEPQPGCGGRKLYWPRGKMLGGSSCMNAMIWHHCCPEDFNEWAEKTGDDGWSYNSLKQYFRKIEKFTPHVDFPVDREHRGTDGAMKVGYSHMADNTRRFLDACAAVGIPRVQDINTPAGSLGATKLQTFIDPLGKRSSAASAYLTPDVVARTNLTIGVGVTTTRIVFENSEKGTPRAVGVEFTTGLGKPAFIAQAKQEVLLTAGSVHSPHLLMLSGIGSSNELEKHNIPLVKNVPSVGKNMKDHLAAFSCSKAAPGTGIDYLLHPVKAIPALLTWIMGKPGPACSNVGEVGAFIRSTDESLFPEQKDRPLEDLASGPGAADLEYIAAPVQFVEHGTAPPRPGDWLSLGPIGLRPASSGTISLSSSDPFAAPRIDPNYLTAPNDVRVLARGARLAAKLYRTSPLKEVVVEMDPTLAAAVDSGSEAQLEGWVRQNVETLYHPVSTVRMGKEEEGSALDSQCRMYGVDGLRVVDASSFPELPAGHTTAPVLVLAERIADIIKASRSTAKSG